MTNPRLRATIRHILARHASREQKAVWIENTIKLWVQSREGMTTNCLIGYEMGLKQRSGK